MFREVRSWELGVFLFLREWIFSKYLFSLLFEGLVKLIPIIITSVENNIFFCQSLNSHFGIFPHCTFVTSFSRITDRSSF